MAKTLGHFSISRAGDEYMLQIEDEDGETLEFVATYEQLDLITESIEELLDNDEEDALEIGDDDDVDEEIEE